MGSKKKVAGKNFLELEGWMELKEAAHFLSTQFAQKINEARVLKYAINGNLKLSVRFHSRVPAKRCLNTIAELSDATEIMLDSNWIEWKLMLEGRGCYLSAGIYDFHMVGTARDIVTNERERQKDPKVKKHDYLAHVVIGGQDGQLYLLYQFNPYKFEETSEDGESRIIPNIVDGYYSLTEGLPKDSELVVRTSAIRELVERFGGRDVEELVGDNAEQPGVKSIEKETIQSQKQGRKKESSKGTKKSNLQIVDGVAEQILPAKDDDLPVKRQDSTEMGFFRLEEIIGNRKKGIPAILPVSSSTWWAGVKSGRFPESKEMYDKCTGWAKSDIFGLLEKIKAGKK